MDANCHKTTKKKIFLLIQTPAQLGAVLYHHDGLPTIVNLQKKQRDPCVCALFSSRYDLLTDSHWRVVLLARGKTQTSKKLCSFLPGFRNLLYFNLVRMSGYIICIFLLQMLTHFSWYERSQ